jgi:hypothetical protein
VRRKFDDSGISEIIGTVLMLSFAIALFTVVSIFVLSYPFSTPSPQVDIVSYIDGTDIIWEHHGGPSLDLDTNLSVTISGTNTRIEVSDYIESDLNSNGKWDIGERVIYPAGDMSGFLVDVSVIDLDSNSVVMMGTLQEASYIPPSLDTSVDSITPYEQSSSPLSLTATGDSDLDNVSLYYRWSNDNSSWGHSGETEYNTIIVNTSSASENTAQDYTSDYWSHTTNDNNNRILIVSYSYENDDATPTTISTVEYGGSSLTQIRRDEADGGTYHEFSELWYLLNPPIGSHNIYVNFSATCRGGAGGAITAYNVNQKAPTADEGTFDIGTPTGIYDIITTTTDNCLIASACGEGYDRTPHSFGSGQTQIYNTAAYSTGVSGSYEIRTSQGSENISHTWGTDGYRAAISLACFEPTNITWGNGTSWLEWSNANNPDDDYASGGWNWTFDFPNGTGYYEFYSIGKYDGDIETAPGIADAICYYNP